MNKRTMIISGSILLAVSLTGIVGATNLAQPSGSDTTAKVIAPAETQATSSDPATTSTAAVPGDPSSTPEGQATTPASTQTTQTDPTPSDPPVDPPVPPTLVEKHVVMQDNPTNPNQLDAYCVKSWSDGTTASSFAGSEPKVLPKGFSASFSC